MKEKQDMKKRNIIRGFLVLVMVVMTGFFINLEITKADEKNTENYHLIPWDDGQSGTYWMDGYLYWIDMKKKKISRYSDEEMTKEEVLVEADKGTCIGECGLLYDDIIYYVLIDNKTHAGNLYSYNLKSRESNKLGAARELQRLEVLVDGKIYGCGYTKTGNPEVFLYDLKGKKLKQICKNGYFGQIVGKYIAIQTISSSGKSGMTLYRKSDGQKIKTITSNCSYYEFIDNTFYYVEPIAEFKYKIKSYNIEKKKTITYGSIKANEFGAITSKYLYYSNGPMIGECKYYKYSFAKKKSIRITEEAFQY